MTVDRCPACGNRELRGGKLDLPGGDTLYEFRCPRCGLAEEHLRSERGFDAWRARWATSNGRDIVATLVASGLTSATDYRALAGLDSIALTGERAADRSWQPAALDLNGRVELWLFTDEEAIAACRAEVGATRLGSVAPGAPLAPVLATLPALVQAIWLNPFDRASGLIVDGERLEQARQWAQRLVLEAALRDRGAAALSTTVRLTCAVIDGAAATETTADDEWLAVFTAPDAQHAFAATVTAGAAIHFVSGTGVDVLARVPQLRATRPRLVGVIVNPAGPATTRVRIA